jgi:heme exporter protein A
MRLLLPSKSDLGQLKKLILFPYRIYMKLIVDKICKNFGEKKILRDISFNLSSGESVAIIGPNGSGKTTLVRIICGLIRPNSGSVMYIENDTEIALQNVYQSLGLVSPYLQLYEELTAAENLQFLAKIKRISDAEDKIAHLMNRLNLAGREDDQVKTFSSGMRQRLKYIFALLGDPKILLLDEPTSNLDSDGIDRVYEIMSDQKKDNILLIATNDQTDLKYGDFQVEVTS